MKYFIIFLSAFMIAACSASTSSNENETEAELDMGLNVAFTYAPYNHSELPPPAIVLSTKEFFSCGNWEFDYESEQSTDHLTIEINSYIEPDGCIRVLAPAISYVEFDDTQLPLILNVRYNGINNTARIEYSGSQIVLVPLNFLNIEHALPPTNPE